MSFKGPQTIKSDGNLGGRVANNDGVAVLIAGGVSVVDNYQLGTVLKCIQASDAEDVGLDAAYDAANEVLVHYDIEEFFDIAPNGTLYVLLVPQGTTYAQMCSNVSYLKKAILSEEANREIRFAGLRLNPADDYESVLEDGLDDKVIPGVVAAQALVDALALDSIYLDTVVVEGREFNGTIANLADLTEQSAENVVVCLGQDPAIADLDDMYADTAAVGTVLGALAVRQVNESIGSLELLNKPSGQESNETFPLTREAKGRWLKAALSSGASTRTLTATEKKVLSDKHYVFMGQYEYADGIFINGDYTAIADSSDFSRINTNRVWNKAVRLLSEALTKKMNSTVVADASGAIDSSTVLAWQLAAESKLKPMVIDGEISQPAELLIDPSQDFLSTKLINVKLSIIPTGVAEAITQEVGFSNPLNQ